jgi:Domain of unknown function (DUF5615)
MPRRICFHLDENCAHAIAAGLRRRGIDVTTTPEMGLLGANDEDQLAFCLAENRVILSYYDPCRGSGGFLSNSLRHLRRA